MNSQIDSPHVAAIKERLASLEKAATAARDFFRDRYGHANAPYNAEAHRVMNALDRALDQS